jgi:hypothetical protein
MMTRSIFILSLFTLILATFACQRKMTSYTPDNTWIEYRRGSCFGRCPVFHLKVWPDGRAEYKGILNVSKKGTWDRVLSKSELSALKAAVKKSDYKNANEKYMMEVQDLPMAFLKFREKKMEKLIQGNMDFPPKLKEVMNVLQKIMDSENWKLLIPEENHEQSSIENESKKEIFQTSISTMQIASAEESINVAENNIEEATTNQILFTLKGDTDLQYLSEKYEKFGFRIIEKLSGDKEITYLGIFNSEAIPLEKMIGILKNDESFLVVQENHQIKER